MKPTIFILFFTLNLISCVDMSIDETFYSGLWHVANYVEDGSTKTSQLELYNFTFKNDGSVRASDGTNMLDGTWKEVTDSGVKKFILFFSTPSGIFEEISEDWVIVSKSNYKLELVHNSGNSSNVTTGNVLTFEKK